MLRFTSYPNRISGLMNGVGQLHSSSITLPPSSTRVLSSILLLDASDFRKSLTLNIDEPFRNTVAFQISHVEKRLPSLSHNMYSIGLFVDSSQVLEASLEKYKNPLNPWNTCNCAVRYCYSFVLVIS